MRMKKNLWRIVCSLQYFKCIRRSFNSNRFHSISNEFRLNSHSTMIHCIVLLDLIRGFCSVLIVSVQRSSSQNIQISHFIWRHCWEQIQLKKFSFLWWSNRRTHTVALQMAAVTNYYSQFISFHHLFVRNIFCAKCIGIKFKLDF